MKRETEYNNALDYLGREIPDEKPLAVPVQVRRVSEVDRVRYIVREMMSRQAMDSGEESFDEADDFDVGDDDAMEQPYEAVFEPPVIEGPAVQQDLLSKDNLAVPSPGVDAASPGPSDAPSGA